MQDLSTQMERVDLSSGAEGMVERLTEQNLALEERVRMLQEELHDVRDMADLADEATEILRESEASLNDDVNDLTSERNRLLDGLHVSLLSLVESRRLRGFSGGRFPFTPCSCIFSPADDGEDVPRPGRSDSELPKQGASASATLPQMQMFGGCLTRSSPCQVRELEGDLTDVQAKEQESILENVKEERTKVANLNVKVRTECAPLRCGPTHAAVPFLANFLLDARAFIPKLAESVTRDRVKSVDLSLHKLEADQAREHIE